MTLKKIFKKIYNLYLRNKLGRFGSNSWLSPFGTYLCKRKILIGNNVYVGKGAYLSANAGLHIGNGVTVGPELMVMGGDHKFDEVGMLIHQMTTGGANQPVIIEDDVWIGARVTLLKGVTIGEGAILGAGAIVTKDVPPYTIYAGNPARRIGFRYPKEKLETHLIAVESKYTLEELLEVYE